MKNWKNCSNEGTSRPIDLFGKSVIVFSLQKLMRSLSLAPLLLAAACSSSREPEHTFVPPQESTFKHADVAVQVEGWSERRVLLERTLVGLAIGYEGFEEAREDESVEVLEEAPGWQQDTRNWTLPTGEPVLLIGCENDEGELVVRSDLTISPEAWGELRDSSREAQQHFELAVPKYTANELNVCKSFPSSVSLLTD